MKKKLLLCGLIAFTAFNFVACDDEDDNNATNNNSTNDTVSNDSISDGEGTNSNLSAEFIEASFCLGDPVCEERPLRIAYKYNTENGEVELITKDVELSCSAIPSAEFAFNGDTVVVRFADKNEGLETDCTCFFNLTSKLKGAESKVYYISTNKGVYKGVSQLDLSKNQEGEIQF